MGYINLCLSLPLPSGQVWVLQRGRVHQGSDCGEDDRGGREGWVPETWWHHRGAYLREHRCVYFRLLCLLTFMQNVVCVCVGGGGGGGANETLWSMIHGAFSPVVQVPHLPWLLPSRATAASSWCLTNAAWKRCVAATSDSKHATNLLLASWPVCRYGLNWAYFAHCVVHLYTVTCCSSLSLK